MNISIVMVILALAVVIILPVTSAIIREIDFRRQIEGKRKMREFKNSDTDPRSEEKNNPEIEAIKDASWLKDRQNFFSR
ncbi:MAG: hypothetical protein LKF52_04830 [Butyrivibrio sp.]|jgi:predicted Holliday junction resolvase-like endonuclease|nr:hypothetical protein [Butyrivibrio sp.]